MDSLITEDIGPNGVPQEAQKFVQSMSLVLKAAIDSVQSKADEGQAKESIIEFLNNKLKEVCCFPVLNIVMYSFTHKKCIQYLNSCHKRSHYRSAREIILFLVLIL